MTRIAVTGASGFLGRHVLAALANRDVEVVAHGHTRPPDHAAALGVRWIPFDLAAVPEDAFARLGQPDVVIHLAWGGLPNYLSTRHLDVELPVQVKFLRGLVTGGLRRLVVAGTCFEYGMREGCLSEDTPAEPATCYGRAKDALRRQLEDLNQTTPFDLRWLRLFYLYGDGQPATSLYSQFRAALGRGDKTFNMSKGDQLRDFMRVEEAAAAIVAAALAAKAPRVLNVCSGTPVSVRELVEKWRNEMAADIELKLGALARPAYEPFALWGDSRQLSALLESTA